MRKAAVAVTLISALLITATAGMLLVNLAKANFLPAPAIQINSPRPSFLRIYQNTSIPLEVEVRVLADSPEITGIYYRIDGNPTATITNLTKSDPQWFAPDKKGFTYYTTSLLENLSEGNHTLRVYSQDVAGKEMSSSVEFTVDTHYKYPEILILSPQNKTYATTELPLTFTSDEKIVSAHYMLDNKVGGNASLTGNTTLTGLSNGTHTITVTVWTERGHASQTTYFSINSENDTENASTTNNAIPTVPVAAASVVTIAVVGAGLLVYFRKRKR